MDRRGLLAIPMLTLVLLAGFLGGYHLAPQQDIEVTLQQGPRALQAELYIYKNGELIHYDPDDPSTQNFVVAVASLLAGDLIYYDTNNIYPDMVDITGAKIDRIDGTFYPAYIFINYDSAYTYNYTMYLLPGAYDFAEVGTGGLQFDSSTKSFILSASIVATQSGTVYGVGVYSRLSINSSNATKDALMLYDDLGANAFAVNANDVVTVVYKITLP
ncbi:hypothetical protein [Aeropyrum globular virus 1]|uniref:hypothetical protein n=1 Tax=Aeropyrum globular virus 1 TaxID=1932713 RepID=UPI000C7EBD75|nr:hypothetical protein C1186_gp26 [Aeropyrum globular virus 1]BBC20959.1 hypothetical protein [Aeropyrum globular virus 1]